MKICLNGAESVGKTTLGKQMATEHNGLFVAEYAREYVEKLTREYTYQDVVAIAQKQIKQLYADYQNNYVVFDTDLIITQVWFEQKWGHCPQFVSEYIYNSPIDKYLLLMPDIPFVADPTRENPHMREQLTQRYLQLIRQTGKPYEIITRNK